MVIDVQDGMKRVLNNKQLYYKLLERYQGRKQAEEIIKAASAGDFETAASLSHALKGVAGNLSMKPLASVCLQVEEHLKRSEYSDELFDTLMENIEAVENEIAELLKNA